MAPVITVSAAVEGSLDEAVIDRLIRHVGHEPGTVYGKNGKPFLRDRIGGYNNAAHHTPWVVLIDLDTEAECAPLVRKAWLQNPAPRMCFRVVVRAIEAWLMADAGRGAEVLRGRVAILQSALQHADRGVPVLAAP